MAEKIDGSIPTATGQMSRFRRFAARRPRMLLLLVNLVGISVILLVVEIVLRVNGAVPGYLDMGYDDFRPLPAGESLKVSREFYTDSMGIYHALPDSFGERRAVFVNSWGFRGPEFDLEDTVRRRIMLIGDSFTWGANAKPIDSSYADLIRRPDLQVFNLGIPGTDPDQYERIAKTYLPVLKPDLVCLFFYMNNDVMALPKDVEPNGNIYHITNDGWLSAYLDGSYIGGPEATYAYYEERFSIPRNNWFNGVCRWTVLGTRFWQVLDRLKWVDSGRSASVQARMDAAAVAAKSGPYSGVHLRRIAALCEGAEVPLRLFVIPGHNAIQRPDTAGNPGMLGGLPYIYPEGLTVDDYYGRPDGHFNNRGHRKMAEVVRGVIGKPGGFSKAN